jgi:hypothetical protein
MRTFLVCTILVFCCSTFVFGQKYETSFYDENTFKNPVEIPNSVLKILKQDTDIQKCINSSSGSTFSADWFEATRIKLNNDKFPDLLVKAKNCPLLIGNATSFWFFRSKQNDYDLVLSIYTISIDILKKQTNGFYNVATSRSTASTTYSTTFTFNGKRYLKKRENETPVKY